MSWLESATGSGSECLVPSFRIVTWNVDVFGDRLFLATWCHFLLPVGHSVNNCPFPSVPAATRPYPRTRDQTTSEGKDRTLWSPDHGKFPPLGWASVTAVEGAEGEGEEEPPKTNTKYLREGKLGWELKTYVTFLKVNKHQKKNPSVAFENTSIKGPCLLQEKLVVGKKRVSRRFHPGCPSPHTKAKGRA